MADDDAGELDRRRRERDLLQLEREVTALRSEIRALEAPWWRRTSVVFALTTLVAAMIPLTTAIQGHVQKQRELALEASKQAHGLAMERERQIEQIRTSYLDRLKPPAEHLRTLRFLAESASDPLLRRWAEREQKEVQKEAQALAAAAVREQQARTATAVATAEAAARAEVAAAAERVAANRKSRDLARSRRDGDRHSLRGLSALQEGHFEL